MKKKHDNKIIDQVKASSATVGTSISNNTIEGMSADKKNVILSLNNVVVKFNVRGRILTAIRNVSLDIYEHESIAIVGESGSGKSVLTKTFAGMLDSNGFIPEGSIIFSDKELSQTQVNFNVLNIHTYNSFKKFLDELSRVERGKEELEAINKKLAEIKLECGLSEIEEAEFDNKIKKVSDSIVEKENYFATLDRRSDQNEYQTISKEVSGLKQQLISLRNEKELKIAERRGKYYSNSAKVVADKQEIEKLELARKAKIMRNDVSPTKENPYGLKAEILARNDIIAKEVVLSIGRYPRTHQVQFILRLKGAFKKAVNSCQDLNDENVLNKLFEVVAFRVRYEDLKNGILYGKTIIDCSKIKYTKDWQMIRGCRIATVFQDPMTSLNPVVTIGKQIMTVILKHQKCSKKEAKKRTIDIMTKVGIPDAEKRFDDYPFEYSGGMRQRIVIAIALSCQPRILICDEPTTALDVTIQAQILELIKSLQKDLGFTTVYITHDLGVVANVAERVAVLYGGQIVELGTVEEIFYEPKHPYTWALLSSLPQLSEKGTDLFSIPGTPPSLYNKIVGDAFAQRSEYAMAIDFVKAPPMFKVSDTHYAKTWLLDPRSPKVEPPENIRDLHEKISKTYVKFDEDDAENVEEDK